MTDEKSIVTQKKSAETIHKQKQKLKKFLVSVIPESWDRYDLEAKYDSTLSYMENKESIIDDIKELYSAEYRGESLQEQKEYIVAETDKFNAERDARIAEEILEYNNKVYVENNEINQFYTQVHRAVNKICQGYSNLAFIKGRGAIGKSWNIRKLLLANKVKFQEICGTVSEAFLYRLLYEHNGEVIWFKDVVKLLKGMSSINLLKSATETETKRMLTKSNYSKQQEDLPNKFLYTGKIIFDYNQISGIELKDDFEALQTRGDFIELAFSIDDMKKLSRLIGTANPWQKEVTEFLINKYEFTGQNLLNLRTQWRAFKTFEYCKKNNLDWKSELTEELRNNLSKIRPTLYSLMGNKAIRTLDLKKLLMKYGIVNTIRTADRRINDWLITEELFKVSAEDRNFWVSINPIDIKTKIE